MKPIPLFLAALTFCAAAFPCAAWAQDTPALKITRANSQTVQVGPSENFTGNVQVTEIFQADEPGWAGGARVTFAVGARTNWHVHPLGQTLIVTSGAGLVQRDGGKVEEIKPGDIVWIPAGVKHWHGASPNAAMTHIAIAEKMNGTSVTWMEKVTDAQYGGKIATTSTTTSTTNQRANQTTNKMSEEQTNEPSRAQQLMGDFAPKLAELTDNVLFGDVWARPELSPRDRSLVTVAALIAGGNTEQLKSHLQRAKNNGVTETELSEVMTHLAFYCGWPRAISAIGVAKDVFKK